MDVGRTPGVFDDPLLTVIVVTYLVLLAIDSRVSYRLVQAALPRPHIPALNGAAVSAVCTTISTLLCVALGFNQVYFVATGNRYLPLPVPLLMLLAATIAPSIGKVYMWRLIREWDRAARGPRVHYRDNEPREHLHRRFDDPRPTDPEP